jgi:hypothetical protein
MVRNYVRKTVLKYEPEVMRLALDAIKNNVMKVHAASKFFGIPRRTLRCHVKSPKREKRGTTTVFSSTQELNMKFRVKYLALRGFPITILNFREMAFRYATRLQRQKRLSNLPCGWRKASMATADWFYAYRKRHPDLSLRQPEGLSVARSQAFNRRRVQEFFDDMKVIYRQDNFDAYPQLIYNTDETGLSTVPNSSSKVIAAKGAKTVQQLKVAERGTLTTVIPTVSAVGQILAPFVVFKGPIPDDARIKLEAIGASFARSKSGYSDGEIFIDYLRHFEEHRVHIAGQKCLLILDGHASHVSVAAADYCDAHGIELACLPPHSSHRLQPLDTHFNKVFKTEWKKCVQNFLRESDRSSISKAEFATLFQEVWNAVKNRRGLIVDSFAHCGLYPLVNNVKDEEFAVSEVFKTDETLDVVEGNGLVQEHIQQDQPQASTSVVSPGTPSCRYVFKTPEKRMSLVHTKKHVVSLKVRLWQNQNRVSSKFPRNPEAHRTPETAHNAKQRNGKAPATAQIKKRVRRTRIGSSSSDDEEDDKCCVCGTTWERFLECNPGEEWLRCPKCSNWTCEQCFGSAACSNCE